MTPGLIAVASVSPVPALSTVIWVLIGAPHRGAWCGKPASR